MPLVRYDFLGGGHLTLIAYRPPKYLRRGEEGEEGRREKRESRDTHTYTHSLTMILGESLMLGVPPVR